MEFIEVIWISGIIISLVLLLKDMSNKNIGPSTKSFWIFMVIVFNVFGLLIYRMFTPSRARDEIKVKKPKIKKSVKRKSRVRK